MNHEGKGEIAEEDRVLACHRRRVTFRTNLRKDTHENGDSDGKPKANCMANVKDGDEQKQEPSESSSSIGEKLGGAERKESSDKLVGILRVRSVSLSPPAVSSFIPTSPRFKLSKLSEAMRQSSETRECIEKLKKRFFHRLEPEQREPQPNLAASSCSVLKHGIENDEKESSSQVRQKRRMVCLENTKAILGERLPPTMMPFVEEALRAAHFFQRRRKENGHGRIIHQILIEQHKRVLKELEQNENRNGDSTNHSSRQQSHKSE